jgi:alanine racemase
VTTQAPRARQSNGDPPAGRGQGQWRPAWAEINLDAVRHNAAVLAGLVAPATLCAVVKADAYGHGAPAVARAALEGGAASLAVAQVDEGIELVEGGVSGCPVLLLSEPPDDAYDAVVAAQLTPTLCTAEGVARTSAAARGRGVVTGVHLKVDTGMHRVGAPVAGLPALVAAVENDPALRLDAVWTHLAVADGSTAEDRQFTEQQLARFDEVTAEVDAPLRHAANSAGAITFPQARYGMVRCGIALYGVLPSPSVAEAFAAQGAAPLRPVLSLHSRVSAVRRLEAGDRPSYGRLRPLPTGSMVATVPIGYADGLPRALFDGGYEVLIGGRRRPLAGAVTMDQIVVDCGADAVVAPGDPVVLLGSQGDQSITADEWAARLGTISYEVLCGIGPRVHRVHLDGDSRG